MLYTSFRTAVIYFKVILNTARLYTAFYSPASIALTPYKGPPSNPLAHLGKVELFYNSPVGLNTPNTLVYAPPGNIIRAALNIPNNITGICNQFISFSIIYYVFYLFL